MIRGLAGLLLVMLCIGGANAQQEPLGAPQPDRSLRDPQFGVVARHVGLERDVEMLQWQATPGGYRRVWSPQPIDSTRFDPDHQNPAFPLHAHRWLPTLVTIDGIPLAPQVIDAAGQWRSFRPSFSALPANMVASFQPEGDGLGSADNPMSPRIGDLRIHWRDLVLADLDGRIVVRAGRWQLVPGAMRPAPIGEPPPARQWGWLLGGAAALLVLLEALRRSRQR